MSFTDKIALLISICAVLVTGWISTNIFEGLAHLEDEFAYVWQAQTIARGQLSVDSPDHPKSFLIPFVVDHNGQRFGKYPLGWPVVLSLGERLNLRPWINPLLAGLGVWLMYRLGKKILGEVGGLLSAILLLTSAFFLMNSGTLLSHSWGLVLSIFFVISWLDMLDEHNDVPAWLPALSAGFSLGVLALSRPLTAFGVAIPFGVQGIFLFVRASQTIRKRVLAVGLIALLVGSLHIVWQFALTGDALLNPYTLWWEYDKFGFGPGFGVTAKGHSLKYAWSNTKFSLNAGLSDLFGWGKLSWLFMPFGLWALRKAKRIWPLLAVFPTLVLIYAAYWVGAWLFGPRYYYEGLYSLILPTAAGIAWLAGWPQHGRRKVRPLAVTALVTILVIFNVYFYIPARVGDMQGLFGIQRSQLASFETASAQELTPSLILVHPDNWREYATFLELSNPFLDSPFVFVYSRGPRSDAEISAQFSERSIFHYYPDTPGKFYTAER